MNDITEPDLFAPLQDQEDPIIDPTKNYIEDLVGEGKKFKTVEDLAKSVVYKDQHIPRLERENAEMRERLNASQRLEVLVDRLAKVNPNQPTNSGDNQPGANEVNPQGLTPDKINEILDQKLTEREKTTRRAANLNEVKSRLQQTFGQNFPSKLREQSTTLGLTEDYLKLLASEQPKAFYRLMNMDENPSQVQSYFQPSSSVNSEGFKSKTTSGEKTKSYYDNLKRTNPNLYKSTAIQIEEHNNAMRLGESFFDV